MELCKEPATDPGQHEKKLRGDELGLAAYFPMDIHNQVLLDRSGNNNHGVMIGPILRSRYFSSTVRSQMEA